MSTEIIRWPDGTECLPEELHEMTHMSDDYERVEVPDDYEGIHFANGNTALLADGALHGVKNGELK